MLDRLLERPRGFRSDRLTFRRMRGDDVAPACARMTAACVAEMSISGEDLSDPKIFQRRCPYGIVIENEGACVGHLTIHPSARSFGIWIAPDQRRRGYASEAVKALLTHPWYGPHIQRVGCFADNIGCRKIIEDNGFVEESRRSVEGPLWPSPRLALFFRQPWVAPRSPQPVRQRTLGTLHRGLK